MLEPKIKLLNIDCLEYMKGLPDKAFELAIIDPPYGIKDDGRKHAGRSFKKNGTLIKKIDKRNGRPILTHAPKYKTSAGYDNHHPSQEYFDELERVSCRQIIWGENYIQFNQKSTSSGRIVWDKVNGETDQSDCETAWTNCHKSIRMVTYMWGGMLQGRSIIEGRISQGNKALCEKRIHPNHKPVLLYKWLLQNYAKEGDRIIDTHCGSGSFLLACHDLGFEAVACEIDKDYYEAALNRLKIHQQQQTLFEPKQTFEFKQQTLL